VSSPTLAQVGERFRHARTDAAMAQADVAERSGLSRASVANFEAGRQDVPLSKVIAMCDAVGIAMTDLWSAPDPCPACGCAWRGVRAGARTPSPDEGGTP